MNSMARFSRGWIIFYGLASAFAVVSGLRVIKGKGIGIFQRLVPVSDYHRANIFRRYDDTK